MSRIKDIVKVLLKGVIGSSWLREFKRQREIKDLDKSPTPTHHTDNLRYLPGQDFYQIFDDVDTELEWHSIRRLINGLELPDNAGGINRGDQRAIFYLIDHFRPDNVLEIGTHIACSTVHIALALRKNPNGHLVTVDIIDVNDPEYNNWRRHNSKHSPSELMEMIGAEFKVTFIKDDSQNFLRNCQEKFDFIFLDGSHIAKDVFQEIALSLNLLNRDGIILLHDYFPENEPLWKDSPAIPGPYLAVKRLIGEETNLAVIPLGELPWETKMNSSYTSLALLTKKHN